jgi:aspartyl-tRNA(Asn)/glutamyl-tRNA(Gln) amidotransferase subunit C
MPAISPEQVAHLASLARLDLSAEHQERLAAELEVIIASVAKVSQVAAADIPPTSHPLPLTNVFRSDVVRGSLTVEQALMAAPAVESDRFRVPRILDEES